MTQAFGFFVVWVSAFALAVAQTPAINDYVIQAPNSFPVGITSGPDGALWFTNGQGIGQVTTSAVFQQFPTPTSYDDLGGIVTGPDGALWFTEYVGRIGRITTSGSIAEFPLPAGSMPGNIAAGPDGALWFTDLGPNAIGRISTGGVITEYPTPTPDSEPTGIALGSDGALWFTEAFMVGAIGRITTAGVITEFAIPTAGSYPQGITSGPDGALWFAETGANQIGRITTNGLAVEYPIPTPSSEASNITAGPDGALWFTEPGTNKIGRIDVYGAVTEYPIPTAGSDAAGITSGPDGALWFTEVSSGRIGRVGLTGGPSVVGGTLPSAEIALPYSATLAASGGTAPYSNWTITSGSLPPGLSLSSSTGVIGGTVTSVPTGGLSVFNVTVQDRAGKTSVAQSFVMGVAPTLQILNSTLPAAEVGRMYSGAIQITGGKPPYVATIISGSLPTSLVLSPYQSLIFSTPTIVGTFSFTMEITDQASFSVSQAYTVNVLPGGLTVTTTTAFPQDVAGNPFQQQFTATGGAAPYVWSSSGTLPTGLSFSPVTATISGTPIQTGAFSFAAMVTDGGGFTAQTGVLVSISPGITITSVVFPNAVPGASYSATIAISGGTAPLTWSITAGSLPSGLTLTPSGTITGIPTSPSQTSNFTVLVTDAKGLTATQSFSIFVDPLGPTITTTTLPEGVVGVAYQQDVVAHVNTLLYTWTLISGGMPPGLSFSFNGLVAGTPTTPGTFTFSVRITDGSGQTATQTLSLTIAPANCSYSISPTSHLFTTAGGAGTVSVTTAQGCPWTVSGVPSWMIVTSGSSGSGTGAVNYVVDASNSGAPQHASLSIAGNVFTIQEPGSAGTNFIGSFPHLAAEGGWSTTFTLINKGTASETAMEAFFAADGTPLSLPVVLPQQSAGTSSATSVVQAIPPGATLLVQAAGSDTVPYVEGSAQLSGTGDPSSIDGFAIFHFDPNSQEAVVPVETRNASSYFMPFDNTSNILTGIALANVSGSAANIPIIVRGNSGDLLTSNSISLAANGHTSFVLSTLLDVTQGFQGTVEFDTPPGGQISVLGIRYTPPGTMTTIPALANLGTAGGAIAHLASGAGWQTTFVLANTGTTAATANLAFFDDQGSPLLLPLQSSLSPASSLSEGIGPNSMLEVTSMGALGTPLLTGSAQLAAGGNVGGFVIFRYNPNGQEAVVPLETRGASRYYIAFDNTAGTATGIAVANAAEASISVPVTVRDDTGATLTIGSIALNANGHTSFGLAQMFPQTANVRGTVEFDAPLLGATPAAISVLGIRSPPALTFTTLPALAE